MRNKSDSKIARIFATVGKLPYFDLSDLAPVETDRIYLKILLSRYQKSGKVIRLKKGVYVARDYIETVGRKSGLSAYSEFLANILYRPSYLSLEYILYQHNLLTEIPVNFTLVTKNKPTGFRNRFGGFFYRKVKPELFCGFDIIRDGEFSIMRATKAKAVFDYLYLRKNVIASPESLNDLRLNLSQLNRSEKGELGKYTAIEGSKKMRAIYRLIKQYGNH